MLLSKGMHRLSGSGDKGWGLSDVFHVMGHRRAKDRMLFEINGHVNISALRKMKYFNPFSGEKFSALAAVVSLGYFNPRSP